MYNGFVNALLQGEINASSKGRRVIMPSSFISGPQYLIQNYHDTMAICRWAGFLDIFLTFTCNLNWPENIRIIDVLGLKPTNRSDLICN